jgi:hypothetical protein
MILLNPGPVNVSARVTAALGRGDLCHREPECAELRGSGGARRRHPAASVLSPVQTVSPRRP